MFFCLLVGPSYGQNKRKVYDGPYIEIQNNQYMVSWIEKGKYRSKKIPINNAEIFKEEFLPEVNLKDLSFTKDSVFQYRKVNKFAAISDIHGQYDLMRSLLITHGIVDEQNEWTYGDGHLVIVGDVFDRGGKVTECLWFIFELEKKAKKKGGRVHMLLGNHELMVLHGDYRYLNPKYLYIGGYLDRAYSEMFSDQTILGSWLRSKKVTISINDFVFVHGGFSKGVLERESSLMKINSIFTDQIIPDRYIQKREGSLISELYFENGPLWYRGYAEPNNFDIKQAEQLLEILNKESIIIGHTSMPQIFSLFGNSIILIDSSIKFGKTGQLLLYENDLLYRGKYNGDRELLSSEDYKTQKTSLFDYIADVIGEDVKIRIKTEFDTLLANKQDEEYYDAEYTLFDSGEELHTIETRIRTRGNMRKKLCELPPLKLDFNKTTLKKMGFSYFDKIKLVLQCLDGNENAFYTQKEHLIYQLYRAIDTLGYRCKLAEIEIVTPGDSIYKFQGFVLEDENQLAERANGEIVEKGIIRAEGLDRNSYLIVAFFQFMIGNNDWSISGRHNIKTIKLPFKDRLVAVPYDFDYSGIVNQRYSTPEDQFPRMDLSMRKLRLQSIGKEESDWIISFYNEKKSQLIEICEMATYLQPEERKSFQKSIEDFYKIINSRKQRRIYWPPKLH